MAALPSLVWLAAVALPGIALLDRFAPRLTGLERRAHGSVLGIVLATIALIPAATLAGFTPTVVVADGLMAVAAAILLWTVRRPGRAEPTAPRALRRGVPLDRWAAAVFGLIVARFATLWANALTLRPDGLWAGHEYIWSDWPTHLGIVTNFAYGDNVPPEHPLFAGLPLAYHYLSDLTPAAFVVLGLSPIDALPLHSFVLSVVVAASIWAFVRRLSGRGSVATLGLVLFLFGGSPGWLATVADVVRSGDLVGTLLNQPWDYAAQKDLHIRWFNPYLAFLMSQRAYLYGLPLMMLALTLLGLAARRAEPVSGAPWVATTWRRALASGRLRSFALAGVVAGLLPLSHLPTLLAMAILVLPLALLLAPRPLDILRAPWGRGSVAWVGWLVFGLIWIVVSLPQLASQLGGGTGALSAFRVQLGWVAGEPPYFDPWIVFWLKNLGLFGPLILVGLAMPFLGRRIVPPRSNRLLVAFQAIFVVANIFVFQPWDWDNHKILTVWFLSAAILVAALLGWAWRRWRAPLARVAIGLVVTSLIASPTLEHLAMLEGRTQYRMLTSDELALATAVREATPPRTLVVTGMGHHDPVMMLAGRRLLMGYWGQLWVSGIRYETRQAEVAAIYAGGPTAQALIERYGVGAVVIGPDERAALGANEAWFAEHYPVIAEVGSWRVYGTGGRASRAIQSQPGNQSF